MMNKPMGLYECILVPTDGSVASEAALEHSVDLARIHDATLHAMYVINTASIATIPTEGSWEGITDVLHREGEEALDDAVRIAEAENVPIKCVTREGSPSREIIRYAEAETCDLIVMGTHGRGGIDRLLLGSVTERVVRSAKVPVLTIQSEKA